ncbi:LPXTG cell wall anchor domain-containing protein [Streptomyces sp. NPDC057717]|uniref:LPXTG cell wall anchor domain-containing protein n=1 Tax=Streptomyces sp. NPDC057717 TaxID=3346224 RepID=UPI0036BC7251
MPSPFIRRCRSAGAALGLAVALPLCVASSAHAEETQECGRIGIEYSADRGQHWFSGGLIMQDAPATRIDVRLKGEPAADCQYVISLASYSTEGPAWKTSGTQKFLGWDTVVLTGDLAQTALDVAEFTPKCFGQIDLYSGDRKFDGTDAPLPHYPDAQIGSNLIAHWNGGTDCATTPPTDSPSPTTTPTTSPSPSGTPTTVPTEPAPSSTTVSVTPTTSESTTTTTAAAGPDEPPTNSTIRGTLASTGSDSTATIVTALAATVLVAAGGSMYLFTRRRRQRSVI